jgi:hypothetical protein
MNVKAVSLTAIAVIEHAESFSTSTAHEARAARAVIASAYIRQRLATSLHALTIAQSHRDFAAWLLDRRQEKQTAEVSIAAMDG